MQARHEVRSTDHAAAAHEGACAVAGVQFFALLALLALFQIVEVALGILRQIPVW